VRRIVVAVMSTVSALVLLFSYHTSLGGSGSSADAAPAESDPDTAGSGSSSKTFTGDEADTQWGVVQVEITVAGGKITKSKAVEYPTQNGRDQEINAYAVPQLNSEVVAAQGADIDTVSGATVTSDGYLQSLQSAIDKANL
jgi:uncharacterized protein with FMN-binding domain